VLKQLDYVGVMAFEFFEVDGGLKANEIAPRVHNSGHWTIEGAECSQFENHLRAVAGLPLGSTAKVGESAMLNFIGEVPAVDKVVAIDDCHLHHYGKAFKVGRKVGHATLRCADMATLRPDRRSRSVDRRLSELLRQRPLKWRQAKALTRLWLVPLHQRDCHGHHWNHLHRPDRRPAGALPETGDDSMGWIMTILLGIAGSLAATYGGQALGIYQAGQAAGFFGPWSARSSFW
jgi:hypothetical protein